MKLTVFEGKEKHELSFSKGDTILTALQNGGIQSISAPCGGNGSCKKCSVNVISEEFSGTCLACTTEAKDGMTVELIPEERHSFADSSDAAVYAPTPGQNGYAIVCDIGTTVVVCQLVDLTDGRLLGRISGSNNQRIFGGDVLSRLKSAEEGHADEIHAQIAAQIDYYVSQLCTEAGVRLDEISIMSVTGNTTMMHFFAGINPAQLGTAPFRPVTLFGEMKDGKDIGLEYAGKVYLCPAVAGFMGSDVVCGLLSSGMAKAEGNTLMLDVGTNTEIVLGNKEHMFACSVDGGATFRASLLEHGMTAREGAIAGVKHVDGGLELKVLGSVEPKGICGSGFIDILGILFDEEILDEMGHIVDPEETESDLAGYIGEEEDRAVFYLTEDKKIFISQVDISKFQMAKAAVSAGIDILCEEAGTDVSALDGLLLGGAFGAFVHRKNAAMLGVIPDELLEKSEKLGNTALAGAISAAVSEQARKDLEALTARVQVVDMPTHPSFNDAFTDNMLFE